MIKLNFESDLGSLLRKELNFEFEVKKLNLPGGNKGSSVIQKAMPRLQKVHNFKVIF